jgi:hypothetical protein
MKAYIKAGNTSSKIGTYIKAKSSFDPDAQAFITAAGLTDNTQKNAINTLVVNCKAAGIWTKSQAIFPFVGGTASSHKWNLKNPLDTNAAFRLVFSGGWTHSSTGATPNGTNAYANTFLNSATHLSLNSGHMSYYSRTNNSAASLRIDMGSLKSGPDSYTDLDLGNSGSWYFRFNNGTAYNFVSATDTSGFFNGNRTASNVINIFRNGTKAVTGTAASNATSSTNYFIGASNAHGSGSTDTPQYFSNRECAFASIGDGLTDTEALVFNQIVEGYQYALGRNINPVNVNYYNTAYNNETNAFLYASQITDNTQKSAVNTFVNDLKTAGIWTKTKAVYPFVGGTASTHKWNLVNPQDTDAAFRLTFIGGWTHSSTGALPNGTNGYADTKFNVNNFNANINSYSLGVYLNSILISARHHFGTAGGSANQVVELRANSTSTKVGNLESTLAALSKTGLNTTTHQGFWAISKRATNNRAMICSDGTFIYNTNPGSISQNSNIIFLAAQNSNGTPGNYDTMRHAFDFFADGLNDNELINLRTAVITFQTTLGRQV